MKVLFVVSTFPALSETFILNQITGFLDEGHDVQILAMSKAAGKVHPDVERYQLMEKVTFVDIPKYTICKLARAVKSFIQYPLPAMRTLNFLRYGKFVFSLRPLLTLQYLENQSDYDTIIAHYGSNGLLLSILEKDASANRFVFFHGNDLTGFVKRFGYKIYQPLFQSDIKILPISNLWADKLKLYGAYEQKLQVHHMGVDVQRFPFLRPRHIGIGTSIKLLLVGRLTEKKGIDTALASVSLLKFFGYPVSLTIIGDGEMREELELYTKDLQLDKVVHFTGWLRQTEVKRYIEEADIIVQPSRTAENGDMEGIPVALMEVLAQGKLVVSTLHSGIPELIIDGCNGLLVPENDALALADKIEKLLQMSELDRGKMSENARKKIEKEFDIYKLNHRLMTMCGAKS
ncbi:colanic acid biosynthesis glycosyltransferase WcaL [Listeria weihenstephanensis]|uniref:Colanic acid biosynthesis glycosyltransferase WcaL n=1 Tax=Listeria weihenstephanensis TaxID=1006155 RepID=A0A841Z974_9LIST|nr:glycosyltransferase [Listeria weihenstephanensis]MBC1501865.1 colanic acid biosynthesis glycosyltransferase WcaL [Listeria weihenstephanensis]